MYILVLTGSTIISYFLKNNMRNLEPKTKSIPLSVSKGTFMQITK